MYKCIYDFGRKHFISLRLDTQYVWKERQFNVNGTISRWGDTLNFILQQIPQNESGEVITFIDGWCNNAKKKNIKKIIKKI